MPNRLKVIVESIARKTKKLGNVLIGRDFFAKIDHKCQKVRFGSQYGGWDIVVDPINEKSIVYSFGIGEDASFDINLIERFGLVIQAFDPTPKSIDWVNKQGLPAKFIFHKYGIANFDTDISFNPPENPEYVSHTILSRPKTENKSIVVLVKRLTTIMNELGHKRIDILKMDIEGAEYRVIDDIEKSGILPQQILVEFHHRFPNITIKMTKDAIEKLKKMGYGLFSISNTSKEFCFILESSK